MFTNSQNFNLNYGKLRSCLLLLLLLMRCRLVQKCVDHSPNAAITKREAEEIDLTEPEPQAACQELATQGEHKSTGCNSCSHTYCYYYYTIRDRQSWCHYERKWSERFRCIKIRYLFDPRRIPQNWHEGALSRTLDFFPHGLSRSQKQTRGSNVCHHPDCAECGGNSHGTTDFSWLCMIRSLSWPPGLGALVFIEIRHPSNRNPNIRLLLLVFV